MYVRQEDMYKVVGNRLESEDFGAAVEEKVPKETMGERLLSHPLFPFYFLLGLLFLYFGGEGMTPFFHFLAAGTLHVHKILVVF